MKFSEGFRRLRKRSDNFVKLLPSSSVMSVTIVRVPGPTDVLPATEIS